MNDARTRQDEVGSHPIEPPLAVALDALRSGDLDRFTDWLHDARLPPSPAAGDALRTLAEAIVAERLDAGFAPSSTVDDITIALADRRGVPIIDGASGRTARPSAPPEPANDAMARALAAAEEQIARLEAERDALEARLEELAGARVLADALASELESDEWIRARLRRLKDTRVARGLIYLRRRLRAGTKPSVRR
jgi:hypothetical protein